MARKQSKERNRAYHLKRTYGITLEQYDQLLAAQDNKCAICHKTPTKHLHIDHDHVTLEIRGLLCAFCNTRLIGRHRDPQLFQRAAEYLSKGTGLFTPPRRRKNARR